MINEREKHSSSIDGAAYGEPGWCPSKVKFRSGDPEYEKFIDELKELEVELYRANAMALAVEHHQKDLSQEKALDRIKIEKGIYDIT